MAFRCVHLLVMYGPNRYSIASWLSNNNSNVFDLIIPSGQARLPQCASNIENTQAYTTNNASITQVIRSHSGQERIVLIMRVVMPCRIGCREWEWWGYMFTLCIPPSPHPSTSLTPTCLCYDWTCKYFTSNLLIPMYLALISKNIEREGKHLF